MLELARKVVLNAPAIQIVRLAIINTTSKKMASALKNVKLKEKETLPAKNVLKTASLATNSDNALPVLTTWFSTKTAIVAKILQEMLKESKLVAPQVALRTVSHAKLPSTAVNAFQDTNSYQQLPSASP